MSITSRTIHAKTALMPMLLVREVSMYWCRYWKLVVALTYINDGCPMVVIGVQYDSTRVMDVEISFDHFVDMLVRKRVSHLFCEGKNGYWANDNTILPKPSMGKINNAGIRLLYRVNTTYRRVFG